jgi:hypothetical protein
MHGTAVENRSELYKKPPFVLPKPESLSARFFGKLSKSSGGVKSKDQAAHPGDF